MPILPIKPKAAADPAIMYRRMLNKLNLDAKEKIETLDFFAPFNTPEKQKELMAIENWKNGQKAAIYNRCFNTRPSFFQRLINFIKK